MTACCKRRFFGIGIEEGDVESGRQMAVGMLGRPPPEPTSSMVCACSI